MVQVFHPQDHVIYTNLKNTPRHNTLYKDESNILNNKLTHDLMITHMTETELSHGTSL